MAGAAQQSAHDDLAVALAGRPWHSLDRADIERELGTSVHGLSPAEAAARLDRHGPNQLEEAPPTSALAIFLHQFRSPLIAILLVAMVVTLALQEYLDASVIGAVLALNAGIGFVQERKAERAVRALMQLLVPRARVVRGGRENEVDSTELVPGDLVLLESGTRVPADLRLISAVALAIDESLLTGESEAVKKGTTPLAPSAGPADRTNMAYTGAVVTSGRGRGYVIATAGDTELGRIAEGVREQPDPETPLQRRLTKFARIIGVAVAASAAAAFAFGIAVGEQAADMFMVAVALAVGAVPEGLPVVFTIALAVGVRRMARRRAIIRRLAAVETIGSVTVIGSDKTGTLTENRMTVERIWAAGRMYTVSRSGTPEASLELDGRAVALAEHPEVGLALLAGVLSNEASLHRDDGQFTTQGDPTETALLMAAAGLGVEPEKERERHPVIAELPFESERQHSASLRASADGRRLFVKGAPERVLAMCDRAVGADGAGPLDADAVHQAAADLGARGLRVLAMAHARLPAGASSEADLSPLEGLAFAGLQAMRDPPRAGVVEAIEGCRSSGIRVVMITGDHADTARAIAADLGIASADAPLLTGGDLNELSDDDLERRAPDVSVYARVTPGDKLRIVHALQRTGQVVAVTGDGVNDAPALKAAEIGIAMGRSGTDVARESADMVLADDNFVSIYHAVEQGRVTFDNLRKATFFLVSTGAALVVAILTALALRWPLLFLPAQILWVNLVTNGVQDVALAFEPAERDVLSRRPRRPRSGIVSRLLWERTAVTGLVMAAGTLGVFGWTLHVTGALPQAQTAAVTMMVLFQSFHVGNARSERASVFRISPLSNPFLLIAVVIALAIHIAAIYLPVTQFVLRFEPFPAWLWAPIVLMGGLVIIANELHKAIRRTDPQRS